HACSTALSTPRRSATAFSRLAGLAHVLSRACRVPDGTRPERAAPRLGAAGPSPCDVPSGTPCLGGDVILPGRGRFGVHAFCTGHSALRSPAAPRRCVPLWGGCWCGVPYWCCPDAVVSGVS